MMASYDITQHYIAPHFITSVILYYSPYITLISY